MASFLSESAIQYFVDHVFLPPKLPHRDDSHPQIEDALLQHVARQLQVFRDTVTSYVTGDMEPVLTMFKYLLGVHDAEGLAINEGKLREALKTLSRQGGTIALQIKEQNASLLISKVGHHIRFEAFELAPTNEAVNSSEGRLKRTFPGNVQHVSLEHFNDGDLQDAIANTLAKMSVQRAAGTTPLVRKARALHEEARDTTDPKLVTDLFMTFLASFQDSVDDVPRLGKNTREEVMYHDAELPWRRSPTWLFVRVSLQLLFSRSTLTFKSGCSAYKAFMVFLMANFVELCIDRPLASEIRYAMNAKIVRRLHKIGVSEIGGLGAHIEDIIKRSHAIIQGKWSRLSDADGEHVRVVALDDLDLVRDIDHKLHALDEYIHSMNKWSNEKTSANALSTPAIQHHNAKTLPSLNLPAEKAYANFALNAFENWVASSLPSWSDRHAAREGACEKLAKLIHDYYEAATPFSKGNPEATSNTLLTTFELWVACDKAALSACSLLADYGPCVPAQVLRSLILPTKSQMERLQRIERYISRRTSSALYLGVSILREIGTETCFSVRYLETCSSSHRKVLEDITKAAQEWREQKRTEFAIQKAKYDNLIRLQDAAECEYVEVIIDYEHGVPELKHDRKCRRCRYKKQAAALTIRIHEWPLPEDDNMAASVVFELMVPQWFGSWRDATIYMLTDVLNSNLGIFRPLSWTRSLADDRELQARFVPHSKNPRIGLLSEAKSHMDTHRSDKRLSSLTNASEVCLANGLRYQYFDSKASSFLNCYQETDKVATTCTYVMPKESASLQPFLSRRGASPSGPSPNFVIASQAMCPEHMSVDEYKGLVGIPIGFRIQWLNILAALSAPTIDFNKLEAVLLLLQTIHQAGPPGLQVLREGHTIMHDPDIALKTVEALSQACHGIAKNWESFRALSIFASIAARILTLDLSSKAAKECLAMLGTVRAIAKDWLRDLREDIRLSTDPRHRAVTTSKAVTIALICIDTFNVDDEHLETLLQGDCAADLVECFIVVREGIQAVLEDADTLTHLLHWRWQRLAFRTFTALSRLAITSGRKFIDDAVKATWSNYEPGSKWTTTSKDVDYCLESTTASCDDGSTLSVHINLLTGELLVNGEPLARLPHEFESHESYQKLFGSAFMEVLPSSASGMRFSSKHEYSGYNLHFGLAKVNGSKSAFDLRLQAQKGGRKYLHIPPRLLSGAFPPALIEDCVHWYVTRTGKVHFRPVGRPWTSSDNDWKLVRKAGSTWRLERPDSTLITYSSPTFKVISGALSNLADPSEMLITQNEQDASVNVELLRLSLEFHIDAKSSTLLSKQYRGMAVDLDQNIGCLVGLRDKLVLKSVGSDRRLLILLEGSVSYDRQECHVRVQVDKKSVTAVHVYEIDKLLQRLVDNGSLQSQLLLSYYHALTSHCLPDRFLGVTGTEQALTILRSAAVRSEDCLSALNAQLLAQIAALTPERDYYPRNERVMQTVKWSPALSYLSQPAEFYLAARSIVQGTQRVKIFYPEALEHEFRIGGRNEFLLNRSKFRHAVLAVSGFGAEAHSVEHDQHYAGRDLGRNTSHAQDAFTIAKAVQQGTTSLVLPQGPSLSAYFEPCTTVFGADKEIPQQELQYDARLLSAYNGHLKFWPAIQKALKSGFTTPMLLPRFSKLVGRGNVNKFRFVIWLSTLAFSGNVPMTVLYTMALFMLSPFVQVIKPPNSDEYDLTEGKTVSESALRAIISLHLSKFRSCPEGQDVDEKLFDEQPLEYRQSKLALFKTNQQRSVDHLVQHLEAQWPCEIPKSPLHLAGDELQTYIDLEKAMPSLKHQFKKWFLNHKFFEYLDLLQEQTSGGTTQPVSMSCSASVEVLWPSRTPGFYKECDLFARSPPTLPDIVVDPLHHVAVTTTTDGTSPDLLGLMDHLRAQAGTAFEIGYVDGMRDSLSALSTQQRHSTSIVDFDILLKYRDACARDVHTTFSSILSAFSKSPEGSSFIDLSALCIETYQWPRVRPSFLLQQLSRHYWDWLDPLWKRCIIRYAVAVTKLQRAERLILVANNPQALVQELMNVGHTNWDPMDHPEALLLEVESGLMIRHVQEAIAKHMRQPPDEQNVVTQLNMGEGKSSVILPLVAASLADHSRLVRVIVARPQSKQMFRMLVSKLGGLLDRRVYRMPFSRSLKLSSSEAESIRVLCENCMRDGGVLLVQPEHILSLRLYGPQCLISGERELARPLLDAQRFVDEHSRDLIDESDEVFSVKFELVYAMGVQQAIDHSPERWQCIHEVLELVRKFAESIAEMHPTGMQLQRQPESTGSFPRTRILTDDAQQALLKRIAHHICDHGLLNFPAGTQPPPVRAVLFRFLMNEKLSNKELGEMQKGGAESIWTGNTKKTLLLLRGLFAGGILAFAFRQKRWRVNYGLHPTRERPTKLAVPYKAKDCPSARSEFSHPDVVIILTSLCYYYGGLTKDELFQSFLHLRSSDQVDIEYQAWTENCANLPPYLRQHSGINLENEGQFENEIVPAMRYEKNVVDYFLAHIVFPKEMKEFSHKLSASGWDLGEIKSNPATGFSGTNDSQVVLPLHVKQLDLPEQSHTNALVLKYLLQAENAVLPLPLQSDAATSHSILLSAVTQMQPEARVILDVGAQIIDLTNLEVAKEWLKRCEHIQAAVFINDSDEICVIDRKSHVQALQTSNFADQLDECVVFLDEAHTRGIDLRLPTDYRAAVTLGPGVTKDRLVQACMRMRQLGKGQAVTFCVPDEIKNKLNLATPDSPISVSDVLCHAVKETWEDVARSVPLWATQGERFERQNGIWSHGDPSGNIRMTNSQAAALLEIDAMTLEQRYSPIRDIGPSASGNGPISNQIRERYSSLGGHDGDRVRLQEEQERELAPEVEMQREVQRPQPAEAAKHVLDPDVEHFVSSGEVIRRRGAFLSAFYSLATTSAAKMLDVGEFPADDILVTKDFARTIQTKNDTYVSDAYHRVPQWILTTVDSEHVVRHLVIISPFEAQELFGKIEQSKKVTLHLYAPQPNQHLASLDKLDLITIPARPDKVHLSPSTRMLLNLFSGQLYVKSYADYKEVCKVLGLASEKAGKWQAVCADGFIRGSKGRWPSTFRNSPVPFMQILMTKIRRNCEGIEKTHMGAILGNRLMHPSDFDKEAFEERA